MSLSKQSEAPRRVFMTGTFDVSNYGDVMFPLIAEARLARSGIAVVPVSPTGGRARFADAPACVSAAQMLAGEIQADGIVVGGGHIIHTHDMSRIEEYRSGGVGLWAGTSLWLGAVAAAARRDVALAWNAPGVPHPFAQSKRTLVDASLKACDYLSVRDQASVELLDVPPGVVTHVVPDTVAEIAKLWPRVSLGAAFRALLTRKGADSEANYLALHVRNRAIAGTGIAPMIDAFCRAQELTPILVAIGPSLGDGATARDVAQKLAVAHVLLDDPASLAEIAAAIAHSRLYIGASLHGYITALAYEVPGRLVARPSYRKFQGFLDQVGREADLARDWPEAFVRPAQRNPAALMAPSVFAALDAHWARLVEALAAPERKRKERRDFLRAWQAAPEASDFTAAAI